MHIAKGFPCPSCGAKHSAVSDTRTSTSKRGVYRRRRRVCQGCGVRFSTVEIVYDNHKDLAGIMRGAKLAELLREE